MNFTCISLYKNQNTYIPSILIFYSFSMKISGFTSKSTYLLPHTNALLLKSTFHSKLFFSFLSFFFYTVICATSVKPELYHKSTSDQQPSPGASLNQEAHLFGNFSWGINLFSWTTCIDLRLISSMTPTYSKSRT